VGPKVSDIDQGKPLTPGPKVAHNWAPFIRTKPFTRALRMLKVIPSEVVTDAAPVYPAVLDELVPAAWHHVEQYANNPIEADHGQLKRRLGPMRGLQTDRTAQVVIAGHAFLQNLRRGHYELAVDTTTAERIAAAFTELARAI
jgi:transposase-like protein